MTQPTWLLAALYVTPVILVCYYLIGRSSSSRAAVAALPEMEISEIYVYPIKSLRAIKLASAIATPHGFAHDRTFMLLEKTPTGYKNMAVASYPQMTQFLQEISPPPLSTHNSNTESTLTIHYLAHGSTPNQSSLTIPLTPTPTSLSTLEISLHGSPTTAYRMPESYNTWFSTCFNFPVELVYLGSNRRSPRFSNLSSSPSSSPSTPQIAQSLTFTDCAPYLITSSASLSSVSSRIASQMDITKFRPNILLSGAKEAWDEDFWSTIRVSGKEAETEVALLHNCVRCKSINVDYATGRPGTGVKGEVLKRLQGDRRVDLGARWSPVFGRYGFWVGGGGGGEKEKEEVVWRVGDKVRVTGVNRERTVWSWPNLG
ncbi:hypothetical protein COCVIDRAFT_39572 [Bipolaris victoriae FI3]|uniref:MOSC domain-containing protein n=1 Tax=Bipolaris victoriae (strain FI3) TaxID=930091 RepID=W7EL39_BIPV3|nr:hypothetical protein COCVIDRAFT_39572 [Bipolaris victoriae FI3]